MAEPIKLVGRTAIIAAIYSDDFLPSAVLHPTNAAPFCLHGLRSSDLAYFDNKFMRHLRLENGVAGADGSKDEELTCDFYPFVEDYPHYKGHICTGCQIGDSTDTHYVRDSATACTKLAEECA